MSAELWFKRILCPVVTEKSTLLQASGQFVFKVASDATKVQIKGAIEGIYKVKVKSVNTLNRKGKSVRFRGIKGRRRDEKLAYVSLEEGHSIDTTESIS